MKRLILIPIVVIVYMVTEITDIQWDWVHYIPTTIYVTLLVFITWLLARSSYIYNKREKNLSKDYLDMKNQRDFLNKKLVGDLKVGDPVKVMFNKKLVNSTVEKVNTKYKVHGCGKREYSKEEIEVL